jgi:chromate transporter
VVIEAVVRVGRRAQKTRFMVALAAAALIAIFAFGVPFPLIVLVAGSIGYVAARWKPELLAPINHGGKGEAGGAFLQLREPKTDNGFARSFRVIAIYAARWIAPVLALGAMFGWHSVFMPIASFFSQMAVVTFGGAYAVLAYVAQEAVTDLGWLRPGEILDGLAMAETTPGPLILVLAFVGFTAAFRMPPGIDPLSSAIIGAALTTWVTFVPCFLWIFLGAPYIERLRQNKALAGALSAITAAVVGVILNLAIWFGLHVVFRHVGSVNFGPLSLAWPDVASIDWAAAGLAVLAAVALFRFKIGMIPTLAGAAILGAMVRLAF